MSDRERDAATERLLREALAGVERPAASDCLDAETLAAWMDGALSGQERSFAEAHASRCGRCRAVLAAMTRTVPAPPAPAPSFLRRWLIVLGPAAATAAAVTLWFAVSPSRIEPPPSGSSETMMTGAPPSVPAPPPPERKAPPSADRTATRAQGGRTASPSTIAGKKTDPEEARLNDARRERESVAKDAAKSIERDSLSQAAARPAAPVPPNAVPRTPRPAAAPQPGQQVGAAGSPVAAPPVQSDQQFRAADLQRADHSSQARARAATETVTIGASVPVGAEAAAPGSLVRWRVVAGRTIEQSVDGGKIWAIQYVADDRTVLVAGAAASASTAWFVGGSGAVIVTTDGLTWQRVAFPEPVNLVAVAIDGPRSATVTAADRRVFVTTDGGKSWSVRQH